MTKVKIELDEWQWAEFLALALQGYKAEKAESRTSMNEYRDRLFMSMNTQLKGGK